MALLWSSKQIVNCTLKNVYTDAYIIYSAGIAFYACIKYQLHFEIIQVSYVLR